MSARKWRLLSRIMMERRCAHSVNRGARGILLAGAAYGLTSAVETFSPMFYAHVELRRARGLPCLRATSSAAPSSSAAKFPPMAKFISDGNLLVFARGGEPVIAATEKPARLMLLGGAANR